MHFGDYCRIEMKRFGVANEFYTHKVIQSLRSNVWVDVPVLGPAKETKHEYIAAVIRCVCCGICEDKVLRFRAEDVERCGVHNEKSPNFVVCR